MNYDASLFDESIFDNSLQLEFPHSSFQDIVSTNEQAHCLLAAGTLKDIPDLQSWCKTLPAASYGKVFIEVFSPIQITPLEAPEGVSVTWLCREHLANPDAPGTYRARGEALREAVDAWLNEWYRADSGTERHFTMWMGARGTEIMHNYWVSLERQVSETPAHQPK